MKNQFRSLDDDEVEFLDSVLESTRAKEAAVKRETMEQLEAFRRQREETEKVFSSGNRDSEQSPLAGKSGSPTAEEEQWVLSGKKRKKGKEKEAMRGLKLRKASSSGDKGDARDNVLSQDARTAVEDGLPSKKEDTPSVDAPASKDIKAPGEEQRNPQAVSQSQPPPATTVSTGLGLGGYSSDDD